MRKAKESSLTGQTVMLKRTDNIHKGYPFGRFKVPVRITGDYPKFLTAVVLTHKNPHGFHPSVPYPITIDKLELKLGIMILTKEDKK